MCAIEPSRAISVSICEHTTMKNRMVAVTVMQYLRRDPNWMCTNVYTQANDRTAVKYVLYLIWSDIFVYDCINKSNIMHFFRFAGKLLVTRAFWSYTFASTLVRNRSSVHYALKRVPLSHSCLTWRHTCVPFTTWTNHICARNAQNFFAPNKISSSIISSVSRTLKTALRH